MKNLLLCTRNVIILVFLGLGLSSVGKNPLPASPNPLPSIPAISIHPTSIIATVQNCGDSVTVPITIHNTGGSILNYVLSQVSDFTENFEGNLDKWNYNGLWQIVTDAHDGVGALKESGPGYYYNNMDEFIQTRDSFIVANKDSCVLSYWLKYSTECCCDRFYVDFQVNSGTWINLTTYGCSGGWAYHSHSLSSYVNEGDFVKIRFRFTSDYSVVSSGISLDQVSLRGLGGSSQWISTNPASGAILPGDSAIMNVTLHSLNKNAGTYAGYAIINSNDPLSPSISIPITMTIIGAPIMVLDPLSLTFPAIMELTSDTLSISVNNPGCDSLKINTISSSISEFIPLSTHLILPPGGAGIIYVEFLPDYVSTFTGTLTVSNGTLLQLIPLSGQGLPAPVVQISPDTMMVSLNGCNDSSWVSFKVKNIGQSTLNVQMGSGSNSGGPVPASCSPSTSGYCCGMGIYHVVFSNIDNVSGDGSQGYQNFTALPAGQVEAGASYPITVTTGNQYSENLRVWIDFNNDGVFNMTNELVLENSAFITHSGTITIPFNVSAFVPLRMRVMSDYSYSPWPTPCLMPNYGQTEDYTLIVGNGLTILPSTASINAGDSASFQVRFLATEFPLGVSTGRVIVQSNDPVNPSAHKNFKVTKIGYPLMTLSTHHITFPELMVGATEKDSVLIRNLGCNNLVISQLSVNNLQFTLNKSNITLVPGDSTFLVIHFNPSDTGEIIASISVINNGADTVISLNGHVIGAPRFTFSPDTVFASVGACGDSITVPVTFHNTGTNLLQYQLNNISDFTEGFESGLDKWVYDGLWQIVTNAHTGSGSLKEMAEGNYYNGMNQYIELKESLLVLQPSQCNLSFWLKRALECCCDAIYVDIQVNGGSWTVLGTYTCTYDWLQYSFNLSTYVTAGDHFKIRFRFYSDGSVVYNGIHLDDILITGTGNHYNWLTEQPMNGTINGSDSTTIQLTFKTLNVPTGTYYQSIQVQTNDPIHPNVILPIYFTLTGLASLQVSTTTLNFPPIMEYTSAVDSFTISNPGCDTLFIINPYFSNASFTGSNMISFILPFHSATYYITFHPSSVGTFNETLTLPTNVGDTIIHLNGISTGAPLITVNPDSLFATINSCDDSVTKQLTIHSTGLLDLQWQATLSSQQSNHALIFDGQNNAVTLGYWSPGTTWTLEAWVKPSGTNPGTKTIVGGFYNCTNWGIVEQDGHFGIVIMPPGGCSTTYETTDTTLVGVWYHIAGTNDGTTAKLYVNGVLKASGPVDPNFYATNVPEIGYQYCCSYNGFQGTIDEVRIWSLPLTQGLIQFNMHNSLSGTEPGLLAYYNFDIGSGTLLPDKGPYGRTGNISGPNWTVSDAPVNQFATITPSDGITIPGDSMVISVKLRSKGLKSGTYNSTVQITSNSPANPNLLIPCSLIINGLPNLAVPDSCVVFAPIMEYTTKMDTVTLSNTGCDTLFISNIYPESAQYSVSPVSLMIPPLSQRDIYVTFQPVAQGVINDHLHIISNDIEKTICLNGHATGIPYIIASQTSFSADVICEKDGYLSLKIKNIGAVPLTYTIQLQNAPWLQVNPLTGTLSNGDSLSHQLYYSKVGLLPGTFNGNLHIVSNDPLHQIIDIPFTFIVENAYHPLALGPDKNICIGTPVTLNAGSLYSSYIWNTGSTDSTLIVSASGFYSIVVSDAFNCIFADTIHIQFYNYPIISLGNDTTICAGVTYTFNPVIQDLIPVAPSIIQVGNGTSITNNVGPSPFGTYFMDDRTQMLYQSSELIALGLTPGNIGSIAFNVGYVGSPAMQNLTIKMGQTSLNGLTGALDGLSTVYSTASYTPVLGWNSFTFTQPFYWNGTQSIVVEVCFSNSTWSSTTSVEYTNMPGTVWSAYCDNCASGCSVTGGSIYAERANIKIFGQGDVSVYNWHGPGGFVSHIRNAVIHNISYNNAGIYTLTVDNSYGCTDKDTIIIAVNPSPIANAGPDQSIIYGTTATLNGSATGGIPPYSYSWSPESTLSNHLISNPIANPLVTTKYRLAATGQNQCTGIDTVKITVLPIYHIDGTITYANSYGSPINNAIVTLKNSLGVIMHIDTTGPDGHYLFEGLINGNYTLEISTNKNWGGVNATDALGINKYVVYLSTLTGMSLSAADANNNGTITAGDALLVLRRTVGLITTFPGSDWIFNPPLLTILNDNVTANFQAICRGDVNNSFVPGLKTSPTVYLSEEGFIVADSIINFPVIAKNIMTLGAVTLSFNIPKDVDKIIEVLSPLEGMIWHQDKNTLMIAWDNKDGQFIREGDTLLNIKLALKNSPNATITVLQLNDENEFADLDMKIIAPVYLSIPVIRNYGDTKSLMLTCQPNPFTDETMITYVLPENGQVDISLYNTFGQLVKEIYNDDQVKGTHKLSIPGKELNPGLYMLTIHFRNGKSSQTALLRIIKIH